MSNTLRNHWRQSCKIVSKNCVVLWNCGHHNLWLLWFFHFELWKSLKNLNFELDCISPMVSFFLIFWIFQNWANKIQNNISASISQFPQFHKLWTSWRSNFVVIMIFPKNERICCVVKLWIFTIITSQFYFTTLIEGIFSWDLFKLSRNSEEFPWAYEGEDFGMDKLCEDYLCFASKLYQKSFQKIIRMGFITQGAIERNLVNHERLVERGPGRI